MALTDNLEIKEYHGLGYRPLIAFENTRAAILNYHPELEPQNIQNIQKHDKSDEIFVLLSGRCTLFVAENESPESLIAVEMEPCRLYNIKSGVWHTHSLDRDGMALVIELDDTSDDNSPITHPTPEMTEYFKKCCGKYFI